MHTLKFRFFALIAGALLFLCFSCRGIETIKFPSKNSDIFYIILDKSGSMAEPYKGQMKFTLGKDIVERMALSAPDRVMNAGLRTFGENYFDFNPTTLEYGITQFSREDFWKTVRGLSGPMGNSALDSAIKAAGEDLKPFPGRIALIIISDGEGMGESVIGAAAELKRQFGPRLCIYTVQTGEDVTGGRMLGRLAKTGQCGAAMNGENLAYESDLKNFWNKAFPEARKPEPAQVLKQEEKKPVPEARPHRVTAPVVKKVPPPGVLTLQVLFDSGKAYIKPVYLNEIKKVADFMTQYPDTKVAIEGHTDNLGKVSKNMKLSLLRAEAVSKLLVDKYGIAPDRIKAFGYGPKRPIAGNATEKGREKNRRVEARRISR